MVDKRGLRLVRRLLLQQLGEINGRVLTALWIQHPSSRHTPTESSADEPFPRWPVSPRAVNLPRDSSYERRAGKTDQEPYLMLHHGTVDALLLHSPHRLRARNSLESFGDSLRDLLGVLRLEYLDEELGI